jgi:hypothetical protein
VLKTAPLNPTRRRFGRCVAGSRRKRLGSSPRRPACSDGPYRAAIPSQESPCAGGFRTQTSAQVGRERRRPFSQSRLNGWQVLEDDVVIVRPLVEADVPAEVARCGRLRHESEQMGRRRFERRLKFRSPMVVIRFHFDPRLQHRIPDLADQGHCLGKALQITGIGHVRLPSLRGRTSLSPQGSCKARAAPAIPSRPHRPHRIS